MLGSAFSGHAEEGRRHARLDEARADGVHAHGGAGKLVGDGLGKALHGGLRCRIWRGASVGPQASDRRRHDDAAASDRLARRRLQHGRRGVLCREEGP